MRGLLAALVVSATGLGLAPSLPRPVGLGGGELHAQAAQPEIESLDFEGNVSFSDEELAAAIVTRETRCGSFFLQPFCWAGADFAWEESYLNRRVLRQDHVRIQVFYWQRGFRNAQVDTTITPADGDAVDILFRIQEGEPHRITMLDFNGLEDVGDEPATADLPVEVGDPLNLVMLDVARDTLARRLRNRGYAYTEVLRNLFIPAGTRDAEVEFEVYPGPRSSFGPIAVTGNEQVAEPVIRRMLPFEAGDLYRRELILEAQRNLYGLDIFRYASIVEDLEHRVDSIVPLQVQVNEGDSHLVRAGGGWNTEECFNAETRWTSRNYFGGARRLVLRGRVSNLLTDQLQESFCSEAGSGVYGDLDWIVSADFNQPFILTPRNSFAASVYAERQSLQNVFVRRAIGLNLGLTHQVSRSASLTPFYRPQLARLDAGEVFFCTSFLVCSPIDIDLLQASNVLAPMGLAFTQDRTDRVVNPTSGYLALAEVETAQPWTGSDFEYHRAVAEISSYFGITDQVVLAGRLRGGWLHPEGFEGLSAASTGANQRIAHPEKRFYAGGSNSVRGYAQNELGPKVVSVEVEDLLLPVDTLPSPVCTPGQVVDLTCNASGVPEDRFDARPIGGTRVVEGNIELRFPVWGSAWGGAAFLDFGHVWDTDTSPGFDDLEFTPGVGLRYSTPIGPVRVDLAYRGTRVRDLRVVTSQIRPFEDGVDDPNDRIGDLPWVLAEDLALLGPQVEFGGGEDGGGGDFWSGFQLHLSIGQAF